MTQKTPQCKVFCPLLASSEHSGVPEDSKSPTFPSVGLHPYTWPKWGRDKLFGKLVTSTNHSSQIKVILFFHPFIFIFLHKKFHTLVLGHRWCARARSHLDFHSVNTSLFWGLSFVLSRYQLFSCRRWGLYCRCLLVAMSRKLCCLCVMWNKLAIGKWVAKGASSMQGRGKKGAVGLG
jgi:hypothetical protein